MRRWAVHIDIEGFGALYDQEVDVLLSLGSLMEGIYLIGSRVFPESPNRLFAHQIGDGFIIVSEFGSDSLEIPVSIAVALLRHVAATGRFAKAAVAEGDFADIQGVYPNRVREAIRDGCGRVQMGAGLMTTFSVMGTALIRACGLAKRASGALLLIQRDDSSRLPKCMTCEIGDVLSVDWLHSDLARVTDIQQRASLTVPPVPEIARSLTRYSELEGVPVDWKVNTRRCLSLANEGA